MKKARPNTQRTTDLVITRTFDAPAELVWEAWTNPEAFKKWWGPEGFSCPHCEIDLRLGGKFLGCMRSPEGKDFWSTGTYKEIKPKQKLVCTDSFADEQGNVVPASHYGMDDFPMELLMSVTFDQINSKTRMTLRHQGFPEGEMLDQAREGWNQSFDKLAQSLKPVI